MVYIRMKSIRGIKYAYLVESVWDKERKQPKQRTIKYLGRVDDVSIDDIPEEYRDDPSVIKFINMVRDNFQEEDRKDRERIKKTNTVKVIDESFKNDGRIVKMLSSGEIDGLLNIYRDFLARYGKRDLALVEFYEQVIIPALNEVGQIWLRDDVGIAIEHVCSNTTLGLIQEMESYNSQGSNTASKGKVVICTPYGDIHSIPCKMVESLLMSKGYSVYNIAPSTPRETVLKYIDDIGAEMVIISVTLSSRAKAAERLIHELIRRYGDRLTIIIGGRGSKDVMLDDDRIIRAESIRHLASLL